MPLFVRISIDRISSCRIDKCHKTVFEGLRSKYHDDNEDYISHCLMTSTYTPKLEIPQKHYYVIV